MIFRKRMRLMTTQQKDAPKACVCSWSREDAPLYHRRKTTVVRLEGLFLREKEEEESRVCVLLFLPFCCISLYTKTVTKPSLN